MSGGKDPNLTAQGHARAQTIATILHKTGIGNVFSTPYKRTMQTAQAVAQRAGLQVQMYDPAAPKLLVERVKALNGVVLVVGHSNTLPELVRLFRGVPGADIPETEYDRLYQLVADSNGSITTILLTSVEAGQVICRYLLFPRPHDNHNHHHDGNPVRTHDSTWVAAAQVDVSRGQPGRRLTRRQLEGAFSRRPFNELQEQSIQSELIENIRASIDRRPFLPQRQPASSFATAS